MAAGSQQWTSRFGFLMAAIGFAVGLGNIWRFPYVTGENGGGAFVVVYLICAFVIGVPILMAEVMIGRRGGLTPPSAMAHIAQEGGQPGAWSWVGYLNLLTAFTILIAYSVVAGWVLHYLVLALGGSFSGMSGSVSGQTFDGLLANVPVMFGWTVVALAVACGIIYAGVQGGIEKAVKVLMPLLFLLLISLALFNVFAGGMGETLVYLFTPDFSKVGPSMLLAAIGQAFFSIGVGMAGMMMFGAYLPRSISIGKSALIIVTADTAVALLAGLVIFPFVFANGLDPAGGTGLIFQTLPVAFAQMPGGFLIGILFFLLLSVAAITSIVGLCEPLTAWLVERFGMMRRSAALTLGIVALLMSTVSILSYNVWSDVGMFGVSLNAFIDFVPNQVFLPLGGLLIAIFVGWFVKAELSEHELGLANNTVFDSWYQVLRFLVVPVLALIFVTGVQG